MCVFVGSGGGVAMTTSQPSNASELQLYNVLKRANLLQYYDTFIAQGKQCSCVRLLWSVGGLGGGGGEGDVKV